MLLDEISLNYISQVLYEPKKYELTARRIFAVNTAYDENAASISYWWFNRKGSAKVLALGADAKDIPFVGEDGKMETAKIYNIATGISFTNQELGAIGLAQSNGMLPKFSIDQVRIDAARRFIAMKENQLAFCGDSTYNIIGCLNHGSITPTTVIAGTGGVTWALKTPQEILKDITEAKIAARANGLFNPNTLVLPPGHLDMLDKPFGDNSSMTIKSWLMAQGLGLTNIIGARELSKENSGIKTSSTAVDSFMVLDNDSMISEIAITRDIRLYQPVTDMLGGQKIAVVESTGGLVIRHPEAFAVRKGI